VSSLFITATGTNVGKTHTTLRLIDALAVKGRSVAVFKPIETGVVDNAPDATILLEACRKVNRNFEALSVQDITAYTFPLPAAPFCADTNHTIRIDRILEKYHQLSQLCDILLVEGAGGLMVPVTKDFFHRSASSTCACARANASSALTSPTRYAFTHTPKAS